MFIYLYDSICVTLLVIVRKDSSLRWSTEKAVSDLPVFIIFPFIGFTGLRKKIQNYCYSSEGNEDNVNVLQNSIYIFHYMQYKSIFFSVNIVA